MVLTVGTVINNYDKDHVGKVMVTMDFYHADGNQSAWLPVLAPYAGGGRGMYFHPEVGDAVIIGFINDDPDAAIVLGGYWNAKNALPAECGDEKNEIKKIQTKGSHQLIFNDNEKGSVTLKTKKGHKLELNEDSDTITISTADGKNKIVLDEKGGKISIDADKDITLKSSTATVKLEGTKVEIKGKNVAIEAEAELALKGKTLKMEAPSMKLDGQNFAAAGANVKIESSGILTLKGSMTKIN